MSAPRLALDLFAGCGGASEGFRRLGYHSLGVEFDESAAESHRLAGHPTIRGDVSKLDPREFHGYEHFHASPPCTTFSSAGRGKGRAYVEALTEAVRRVFAGEDHGLVDPDETTLLTLEPARWLRELTPETISFEQVRAVLPIWEAYAECLRERGYSVATGLVDSETLGVPQTRVRAWLVARSDGREARLPRPTHSRYYPKDPTRLDPDVAPWVTMAEALGWTDDTVAGFPRRPEAGKNDATVEIDGEQYRARDLRPATRPALAVTEKSRSWSVRTGRDVRPDGSDQTRSAEFPSPTVAGQSISWTWKRPATTVLADRRLWAPGHKVNAEDRRRLGKDAADERYGDRAGKTALRLDETEALVLQSFPRDYPLAGTRTSKFRQIGNAVPPRVAEAVLRELTSEPEVGR